MTAAAPFLIIAALAPPEPRSPAFAAVAAVIRHLDPAVPPLSGGHRRPARWLPASFVADVDALGPAGWLALLDHVFPESARPAVARQITRLTVGRQIGRLGADDYHERAAATHALSRLGPEALPAVEAAEASHPDAEVRLRAGLASAELRRRYRPYLPSCLGRGFRAYLSTIRGEDRLGALADRLADELATRVEAPVGEDAEILSLAITAVVGTKDDGVIGRLRPTLRHPSDAVAAFVVDRVGRAKGDGLFCPAILVEALVVGREAARLASLAHLSGRWDPRQAPVIQRELWKVFDGGSDTARFLASRPLAMDFGDPDAFGHLLAQLGAPDGGRAKSAAAWAGEAFAKVPPASREEFRRVLTEAARGHRDPRVRAGASEILRRGGP